MNPVAWLEKIGRVPLRLAQGAGELVLLFWQALVWLGRPPFRARLIFKQMEFVGVRSLNTVLLTGAFTGGVFALQTYYGFSMFGAETLVGSTVALAITRELGPVLTGLMVTGRAGSAMAAELGTMRVTEQIDALAVMAVNPVQYLITPRVVAGTLMLPLLTVLCDLTGIVAGYLVGVGMLGINGGIFVNKIIQYLAIGDVLGGMGKAALFGAILSLVGCYKGFFTRGGAEGVGRATTEAVVLGSILVLGADYMLTAIMF
ncbi:MAG: ABC transporter permease [Deltaproteobacteria bacterium]|nr:ABC transporter permease [Deltaproteobacteria bacterium]